MNTATVCIFLLSNLVVQASSEIHISDSEWSDFKVKYGKVYESQPMDAMRKSIYVLNKQKIEKFHENFKGTVDFELGINRMSDWTKSELAQLVGFMETASKEDLNPFNSSSPHPRKYLDAYLDDSSAIIPDFIDWRQVPGRVTKVKDQSRCASGWAFATTGSLEGQIALRDIGDAERKLIPLSEQNLIDCLSDRVHSCFGGWVWKALLLTKEENGINDEFRYPYEAIKGSCRFNEDRPAFANFGYAILPRGDESSLKKVVATFGPVAVHLNVDSFLFKFYKSGIFYNKFCASTIDKLNHAVLIVGYGTDPIGGDYWILKNSFSTDWGEDGYMRLARNRNNQCGIATLPVIPTFID